MSKVITFSRVFPSYHPRKGEPTFFVEKIWSTEMFKKDFDRGIIKDAFKNYEERNFEPKWHTIRAGKRWKVGDKFSPRVWSGKPYASKQIVIAPDIEIKKVWNVRINPNGNYTEVMLTTKSVNVFTLLSCGNVAENDGLDVNDFINWFQKAGDYQIICWNENINY